MKTKLAFLLSAFLCVASFAGLLLMTPVKKVVSGGFSPTDIAGLVTWYDAQNPSSYTLSGSAVTNLTDLSSGGNNAVQATGANQFAYNATGINGFPSFDSAGAAWMTMTNNVALANHTFVVVVQNAATGANCFNIGDSTGAGQEIFYLTKTVLITYTDPSAANQTWTFASAGTTAFTALTSTDGTSPGSTFYKDGTLVSKTGSGTYTYSANVKLINKSNNYGDIGTGKWGEFLVYNSILGSTDRANLQAYLSAKWGTP